MAYGIQILGSDGSIGLQIDQNLPNIIASGSFSLPAGAYAGTYAALILPTEHINSTLTVTVAPSTMDSLVGWNYSFSKYYDTPTTTWYMIINCLTYSTVNHVAQTVTYNIIAW